MPQIHSNLSKYCVSHIKIKLTSADFCISGSGISHPCIGPSPSVWFAGTVVSVFIRSVEKMVDEASDRFV